MNNPYYIDEPACISFSGGRSSAYMLYQIIQAHGGTLPDYIKVCFANTGKEMPQTLDFVKECGDRWGVDIVWLECFARKGIHALGENKFFYETRIVDYASASRNGEPFASLLEARGMLPNVVARFCTQELKVLRIRDYMTRLFPDEGREKVWVNVIGIRGDEPRRFHKNNIKTVIMPMYHDRITKENISAFWKAQNFDLELPNNNGTTDWGNCDLCYLKGFKKRLSIIRERPELADWWIKQEENSPLKASCANPETAQFRKDEPSYRKMKVIATDQQTFDFGLDETIPCFCGD